MKYTYDLGFIIAKNTETGERTRAKMTDLRRQYDETGTLPPEFDHRIAKQLIGISGNEKSARFGTKQQPESQV